MGSEQFESVRQAIVSNNNQKAQNLISANPTVVERFDEDGWNLLHYAAKYGNLEAIRFLLSKGANFNITTTNRNKPLHIAASQ